MLKIKNKNVFFSSDWHINHIRLCRGTSDWDDKTRCRDFDTLEQMWEIIRDNVNKVVQWDDIIINLGDIIFGDKTKLPDYLNQINCRNWLYIKGNHCDWMEQENRKHFKELFNMGVYDYKEISINGRLIILSHYAMRTWRDQHKGSIQLYAHSHGSLPDDLNALSMDVGVDTCLFGHTKYTPYNVNEIFSIMDNHKKCVVLDHHKDTQNEKIN